MFQVSLEKASRSIDLNLKSERRFADPAVWPFSTPDTETPSRLSSAPIKSLHVFRLLPLFPQLPYSYIM